VYGKIEQPGIEGKGEKVENSTDRAKILKIENFGTQEEVREMAKTSRTAHSYDEARSILRELVGKPLNSRAGIRATISHNSVDKILSGTAVDKSVDKEAHFWPLRTLKLSFPMP
jgi:hypothetical protein